MRDSLIKRAQNLISHWELEGAESRGKIRGVLELLSALDTPQPSPEGVETSHESASSS